MQLQANEYSIVTSEKDGHTKKAILITKEALEEWRDHYNTIARSEDQSVAMYYGGRADNLNDLLLHFKKTE